MVAETKRVCIWKSENQAIRVSSAKVISYVEQKIEFSRESLEETMGLTKGQAYWHINNLIRKKIIIKTSKTIYREGKGKGQSIYKKKLHRLH